MNGSRMGQEGATAAKHGVPTWPARGMSWYVYYNGTTKMRQQRMKLEARVEVRKVAALG